MTKTSSIRGGFRADIQALRAIAVAAVVIYHMVPNRLPGGYLGVDVFFVISGYLITSHLVRQAESPRGLRLGSFYARRIRRLIPASLLVLAVTGVLTLVFLPELTWLQVLPNILASGFYVANWKLAADAVDYLALDATANPVQHFWTLSVEEQFYFVWPLLILAGLWAGRRFLPGTPRVRIYATTLSIVLTASLVTSVIWTASDAASAYFVTPTRAWEFAAGGLLSFIPKALALRIENSPWSSVLAWSGLAIIGTSTFLFHDALPFPGWIAAIPVGGTLLVIMAGNSNSKRSPQWLYAIPPVQWLGSISYSLYLWHFPVIIFAPTILEKLDVQALNNRWALLAAMVLLAWLSRLFVEDPVISGSTFPALQGKPWRTFASMGVAMTIVAGLAFVPSHSLKTQMANDRNELALVVDRIADGDGCSGGPITDALECDSGKPWAPSSLIAHEDLPPNAAKCTQQATESEVRTCSFGVEGGTPVALVGDSHVGQWVTVFRALAEKHDWEVTTYLRAGCPLIGLDTDGLWVSAHCSTWSQNVIDEIADAEAYSAIFVGGRNQYALSPDGPAPAMAEAMTAGWESLKADESQLVVLADTPNPDASHAGNIPDCVTKHATEECDMPRDVVLPGNDPAVLAARKFDDVPVVNPNDLICTDEICPVIIGGVLVYRDSSHVSETYIKSISPLLESRIESVLDPQLTS